MNQINIAMMRAVQLYTSQFSYSNHRTICVSRRRAISVAACFKLRFHRLNQNSNFSGFQSSAILWKKLHNRKFRNHPSEIGSKSMADLCDVRYTSAPLIVLSEKLSL